MGASASSAVDVTVLLPCLNEERTVGACVEEVLRGIGAAGVNGEVLVVDNGSVDRSIDVARAAGARVITETRKGYGSALRAGITAAGGRYVVMGDADGSYDFLRIKDFLPPLRDGHQLVMGNRFKGGIEPGAMPPLHKIGNPMLTFALNLLFGTRIGDAHCGMRAFSADAARSWDLRTLGMEFASEIVVKARMHGASIAEIPFPLRKDRRDRSPHLRSFRDGWRHLRYLLLMSPSWVIAMPAMAFLAAGLALLVWLTYGPRFVGAVRLDVHMMIFAVMCMIVGHQMLMLWVCARIFGWNTRILPRTSFRSRFRKFVTLERGLALGVAEFLVGFCVGLYLLRAWYGAGFGELNIAVTLRYAIWSLLCIVLGIQTISSSFFLGFLQFQVSPHDDEPEA
jgi:glycosyltransferase involved in cell wall biosynthesis